MGERVRRRGGRWRRRITSSGCHGNHRSGRHLGSSRKRWDERRRRVAGCWPVAGARRAPARAGGCGATGPDRERTEWRLGFRSQAPAADRVLTRRNQRRAVGSDPTARIGRERLAMEQAKFGPGGRALSRPRPTLWPGTRGHCAKMGRGPVLLLGLRFSTYTVKFVICFTHFQKHFL